MAVDIHIGSSDLCQLSRVSGINAFVASSVYGSRLSDQSIVV